MRSKTSRRRGRPAKITEADEWAIYHARTLDEPVAWKDLMAQYQVSRSVLAEAFTRAKVRISGHQGA
jgi:hypothetical protein